MPYTRSWMWQTWQSSIKSGILPCQVASAAPDRLAIACDKQVLQALVQESDPVSVVNLHGVCQYG